MVVVRSDWFELARGGTEPSVEEEQIFFCILDLRKYYVCLQNRGHPWRGNGKMQEKWVGKVMGS